MDRSIPVRDANQNFTRYLREVEKGQAFVITRRGQPVAKLVPMAERRTLSPAQEAAHRRSMARLRKGWRLGGERFDRDSLYER